MSANRIPISDFRNLHVIDSGGSDHGLVLVHPDDLAALVAAVEAADTLMHYLNDDALKSWGLTNEVLSLRAALARFDFGDT